LAQYTAAYCGSSTGQFRKGDLLPAGLINRNVMRYKDETVYIIDAALRAQQVYILDTQSMQFAHAYTNYIKAGKQRSFTDPGLGFLTFSESPGTYQPLGHFDASRSRELDLIVTNKQFPSPATLFFEGCVINFIYMSNGNAVLRYTA
jgi:hypothetical protein